MSQVQATKPQVQVDFYEIEEVERHLVFPEIYPQGSGTLKRRKNRHPDCVRSNPNYIPNEQTLRKCLAWWYTPMRMALGLHGETGTGKTEMLMFLADRLNEPFYMIKVHQGLRAEDIEGSKELVSTPNGVVTRNSLGLAAKAYRNGGVVVFDELDKGGMDLHCAIHGLVEGKPWPVEQFGLVLTKHPMCRITATANTTGEGGHDRYHTSNRMDQALRSRIAWLKTHFPLPAHEMSILSKSFPMFPSGMVKDVVKLANSFRDAVLGSADPKTGERKGGVENPMNCIFSTRTAVNWLSYTMAFGPDFTWRESFDFVMEGSIDPESRESAQEIIQRVLNELIDTPVRELITHYKGNTAGKP